MARTIVKIAAAGLALAGIALAVPVTRRAVVARFNDPLALPALESDARVHFEPAARSCAERVAALLPGAMERIEAAQGRPFAGAPIVGVYASYENYARANALGTPLVAAVSWSGRVTLSPTLCGEESDRLPGILTHELSHTHLFGWRSEFFARPPSWFTEGLAVMVSDGGGAEGVSEAQAAEAMGAGYRIVVDDALWRGFGAIPFEKEPPAASGDPLTARQRLAYREAAMFVARLRENDPKAFAGLLVRLMDNESFDAAFMESFVETAEQLWSRFAKNLAE